MNKSTKENSIRKAIIIILGMVALIIFILSLPEESNLLILMPFFIGGVMGYTNSKVTTKIDVYFHYILLIVFFLFWYFSLPNNLQSILLLLGALTAGNLRSDLKHFD